MSNRPIRSIDDLIPDDQNANLGSERGTAVLEYSFRTYGAGRSIVADKHGRVIAGNKSLEQAAALGMDIEVVKTDGKKLVVVQREDLDLDTEQGRGLAYLDNRASEVSLVWDAAQIVADHDAGLLPEQGWSEGELDLLRDMAAEEPPSLDDLADEYGDPDDSAFWPDIKVRVSPETFERYESLMRLAPGDTDADKVAAILDAVDTGLLG